MKAITLTIITATVISFAVPPLFAADMWAETPDLNDNTKSSNFTSEPVKFIFKKPEVDLWAETPDLSFGKEKYTDSLERSVSVASILVPELYKETPDLNVAEAVEKKKETEDKGIYIAGKKKNTSVR